METDESFLSSFAEGGDDDNCDGIHVCGAI